MGVINVLSMDFKNLGECGILNQLPGYYECAAYGLSDEADLARIWNKMYGSTHMEYAFVAGF